MCLVFPVINCYILSIFPACHVNTLLSAALPLGYLAAYSFILCRQLKSSDERWNGRLFMFKKSLPLHHVVTLTGVHEACSKREIMAGVILHNLFVRFHFNST
jgi:hypothetical protein